jgi:acyl transferase domain-containing protein
LIETQGISEAFKSSHSLDRPLIVGAAKTCVGHTENAAGLVGIVKTLLSFEHELVPGLVHLTETNLNPSIDCSQVPMLIPVEGVKLDRGNRKSYRALVL